MLLIQPTLQPSKPQNHETTDQHEPLPGLQRRNTQRNRSVGIRIKGQKRKHSQLHNPNRHELYLRPGPGDHGSKKHQQPHHCGPAITNLKSQTHEPTNQSQTRSSPRCGLHRAGNHARHRLLWKVPICNPNQLNYLDDILTKLHPIKTVHKVKLFKS